MKWLVAISPLIVMLGSMIWAENRNWGFAARLGFAALVTFPMVFIAVIIVATR